MNKKYPIFAMLIIFSLVLTLGCSTGDDQPNDESGHGHSHGDTPYEWSAQYVFEQGTYTIEFKESGDPSCMIAFIKDTGTIEDLEHHAQHIMEADMDTVEADGHFTALNEYAYNLLLNPEGTVSTFDIEEAGAYTVFLEHYPWEFDMKILDSNGQEVEYTNQVEY